MTKYVGVVAVGYGSIVAYSGILDIPMSNMLLTGFGIVVAITGAYMVAGKNDGRSTNNDE